MILRNQINLLVVLGLGHFLSAGAKACMTIHQRDALNYDKYMHLMLQKQSAART